MPNHSGARLGTRGTILIVSVLAIGPVLAPEARPQTSQLSCDLTTTDRIVAVGDIHGAYDRFVSILQAAELLDEREQWIGGAAVLVQTGDVVDRGDDSRRVLDLLRRLEEDAAEAGGSVHALIGNHEVMRMVGDYRYVSDGEYAAFQSDDSERLRELLYQRRLADQVVQAGGGAETFDEAAFREAFMESRPLGLFEMVLAFGPGEYGQWIREHDVMVVINGIVFVHGGVSPYVAPLGCAAINAVARVELQMVSARPGLTDTLIASAWGPLWYRGLAEDDAGLTAGQFDAVLDELDARAFVLGHTVPDNFRVQARLDDRVFLIDSGMLGGSYYPGGAASAIEFRGDTVTAIYEDRRELLVGGGAGSSVDDGLFAQQVDALLRELQNRVTPEGAERENWDDP